MAINRKLGKTTDIRLAMLKTQVTDLLLHVDDNFLIDVEAYSSFSAGNVIKGTNYAFRIVISEEVDGKNYKKLRLIQVNFIRGKYDADCNYLTEGFEATELIK